MGAVILLRNFFALVALLAVASLVVWEVTNGPIGRSVSRFFRKRADLVDVEKMDDAEIIARKYEKQSKRRGLK